LFYGCKFFFKQLYALQHQIRVVGARAVWRKASDQQCCNCSSSPGYRKRHARPKLSLLNRSFAPRANLVNLLKLPGQRAPQRLAGQADAINTAVGSKVIFAPEVVVDILQPAEKISVECVLNAATN